MATEKILIFDEQGNAKRMKVRIARFLDNEPVTADDKTNIRTTLDVDDSLSGTFTTPLSVTSASDSSFTGGGKVGIGVTPDRPLHVGGSGEQTLRLENTDTALGDGDVVGSIEFEANDASGNGSGVVSKIQAESLNAYGNIFGLSFHTGHGGSLNANMVLDNDGRLGIGTSSPNTLLECYDTVKPVIRLSGNGNDASGTNYGSIEFYNRDSSGDGPNVGAQIHVESASLYGSGGELVFSTETVDEEGEGSAPLERVRIDSTGNVTINNGNLVLSSGAIDFGSGDTLDSYEEGTWTPTYAPGGGSFTTMNVSYYGATYAKIGRLVHYQAYVATTDVDVTGASGVIKISGLPFSNNYSGSFCSLHVGFAEDWTNAPAGGYIGANSSSITLTKRVTGITGNLTSSNVSDLQTGTGGKNWLLISGTYMTNS